MQTALITTEEEKIRSVLQSLDVSEGTRKEYEARIHLFREFVQGAGFTVDSFLAFKRALAERSDLSVSTKNKYLATARVFLKELNRRGVLPADITQNVKGFSQSKKHKKEGLTQEEVERVMSHLSALTASPESLRLKAIISLLLFQGLRQVEVVRLDVRDVDTVNKTAFVLGKGRDDKEPIDLHPSTVKALREYMDGSKVKDGVLFPANSNNARGKRLSVRGLREIASRPLAVCGVKKSLHGFRHYFTTTLIKACKGDIIEVSKYTRHRNLEMLQVYNDNLKHKDSLPTYYKAFTSLATS